MQNQNLQNYYNSLASERLQIINNLKKIILKEAPEAIETFSYGMPVFKYRGKYLIGVGAFKNHISLFPGSEVVEAFEKDLINFKTSKGTIQIPLDYKLPNSLLNKIIRYRIDNISDNR